MLNVSIKFDQGFEELFLDCLSINIALYVLPLTKIFRDLTIKLSI